MSTITRYATTKFVNIILEKRFYMRVEKIAEELGSKPDIIINNILLLTMKKLESITNTLARAAPQEAQSHTRKG